MRKLPGGLPMAMVLAHHLNMVRNPSDLARVLLLLRTGTLL